MSSSLRHPRRLAILVAVGALALAGCGGGDDAAEPTTPESSPSTAAPATEPSAAATPAPSPTPSESNDAGAVAVPAALDFTAPLVGGGEIEMGEFAGRPVLLWFWAPW